MKTLAVILHWNTTQYTDQLYEMLKPYERDDYDLVVLDNGSDGGKVSKYTGLSTGQNVYFGGSMNLVMDMVLEDEKYDSLMWMNNDLIVHGHGFVREQRKLLGEFDITSPCIIQPEQTQNHWTQMLCWGKREPREVKWIDLQCPLISRHFIENLKEEAHGENCIDDSLIWGWGIDIWFGIVAERLGWKTCVCDFIPAVHMGSATVKSHLDHPVVGSYWHNAEVGQAEFFRKTNLIDDYQRMRQWAESYKA